MSLIVFLIVWKSIQWARKNKFMVIVVKKLVFKLIWRIATLMNLIIMIVPKPMMRMLSRHIQLLRMMLNKMMYPKILFKAYKTELLVRMLGWKKQMRQPMFVEKLPSVIQVRIYLFQGPQYEETIGTYVVWYYGVRYGVVEQIP